VSAVKLGYTKVYVLPAGIMGWKKAQKPVENG
jgi:rhodanese-related sulfurtransferase